MAARRIEALQQGFNIPAASTTAPPGKSKPKKTTTSGGAAVASAPPQQSPTALLSSRLGISEAELARLLGTTNAAATTTSIPAVTTAIPSYSSSASSTAFPVVGAGAEEETTATAEEQSDLERTLLSGLPSAEAMLQQHAQEPMEGDEWLMEFERRIRKQREELLRQSTARPY